MPDLAHSLQGQDLGHLRIVAELWGLDFAGGDERAALDALSAQIPHPDLIEEIVEALPAEAQAALAELASQRGRMPWSRFARRYGELRRLGAARRDKEQPQRNPESVSEVLWYRALIARAMFDSPDGPREFAYIPDDLLAMLPAAPGAQTELGRPARPEERALPIAVSDHILDQATTLLAALRMGLEAEDYLPAEDWRMPPATLQALLAAARILDAEGQPIPEATRAFLEAERGGALGMLANAWLFSESFNELRRMPGLVAEGAWENDALAARHAVIGWLERLPAKTWWSLPALIADVKSQQPDFQRPAGDFDSWYVKDGQSGDYLRGFAHWDAVDGALISYLVRGPLHWLGIVELAAAEKEAQPQAFRLSGWAKALLSGRAPQGLPGEQGKISVDSQGLVAIPRLAPRATRYLVARFCTWEAPKRDIYCYRIGARALEAARQQGLEVRQLLALLKANIEGNLPPNLLRALERWQQHGTQAQLEPMLVLRLSSAAALKALRESRAARYLGEPLGPNAVAVKAGAADKVMQALTEMGYLGEWDEETGD